MANTATACAEAPLHSAGTGGKATGANWHAVAFGGSASADGAAATHSNYRTNRCGLETESTFGVSSASIATQREQINDGWAIVAATVLLNLLVIVLSSWQHRQQTALLEHFEAERRVLRQKLAGGHPPISSGERVPDRA